MLSRQKEALNEWISDGYKAREEAKRVVEESKHQRLVTKLGGELREWYRRQSEDEKYLKQEGAVQVFKDAQKILKPQGVPGDHSTYIGIIKPEKDAKEVETYLELLFAINSRVVAPHTENPYVWTARQVLCFVARDDEGPVGFRISGSDDVIHNRVLLGRRLIEIIKKAPTVNFNKAHWKTE